MINTILKYLIALAVSIGIAYLGYICIEKLYTSPIERDWSWMDWTYFMGMYFIIVRPVCNYWSGKISDIIGISNTNEKPPL